MPQKGARAPCGWIVGHTEVIAVNGALSRIIGAFQDGKVRELEPGRSALWIFVLSDVPELGYSFLSLPDFVWAHRIETSISVSPERRLDNI